MLKRFFDLFLVCCSLIFVIPLSIITYLLVKTTSKGPALYWSKRIGVNNTLFNMPKFRSMKMNTPAVATHILNSQKNPSQYLTLVGSFIRKTSLDELPQLFSVLKGDMSIVGPRPALYNQDDLVELRTQLNVHTLKPGITGWAQINGRDEISISKKAELDRLYLRKQSISFDCYIILLTIKKVLKRDDVSH